MGRAVVLALLTAVLSGCGGISSVPYQDPLSAEGTARIRVITNSSVFGDSIVGSCAPTPRHKFAEAGRFHNGVTPNPSYPQYPATPSTLGMPKSYEPEMVQYIGAVRMAEGLYTKVVTEHRVRADVPFQLASLGAAVGSYGSTYSVCKAGAKVYKLEPGKDYQAIVGVGRIPSGSKPEPLSCFLGLFELLPVPDTEMAIPLSMKSTPAPEKLCDS
ncbi:hypothetical protein [Pseudomonas sp. BN411]|uniref:hypothetical protein n=1 Tax=Pseudomonas sp. BN411 TaxID=2567887 RepID=UPI002456D7FA|nr:hypothetical protein [Pseudomonas sp. BN411]